MSCDVGEVTQGLENELCLFSIRHSSFFNPSVALPTLQLICKPSVAWPTPELIIQSFRCFAYDTAYSPTLPSLYLRHSSFSNLFRHLTCITAHSPTLPSHYLRDSSSPNLPLLHLRQSSLSNPFVASPTSQLILHPFRCFTYVKAHSPTLPLLHLRHSHFSNPSFATPTSQALHLRHLASRPCRFSKCFLIPFSFNSPNLHNCRSVLETLGDIHHRHHIATIYHASTDVEGLWLCTWPSLNNDKNK